jgi:hypothetical protein
MDAMFHNNIEKKKKAIRKKEGVDLISRCARTKNKISWKITSAILISTNQNSHMQVENEK